MLVAGAYARGEPGALDIESYEQIGFVSAEIDLDELDVDDEDAVAAAAEAAGMSVDDLREVIERMISDDDGPASGEPVPL